MTRTLIDSAAEFVVNSWLPSGTIIGCILLIYFTKVKLFKDGYITLGDMLKGAMYMIGYILLGWISLLILGIYLQEHFEELTNIKIYRTKEFKTKILLYKDNEDD